jgi:lysozyme
LKVDPDDPEIRNEFNRWIHGGGKVLPGLVTRRKAEADLYFS